MTKTEAIMGTLPQTQCEECDHKGCLPYAQAIAQGEDTIDRCAPGGTDVLNKLATITEQSPKPWEHSVQSRYKAPSRVVIDPAHCIGCTKCIDVCPTNAIVGGPKAMHVIIEQACTGCDLCIPVCPTDCMHPISLEADAPSHHDQYRALWRNLYETNQDRITQKANQKARRHNLLKNASRLKGIQDAMLREKARKDQSS